MKKKVELPLAPPIYTTYHYQGSCGAALYANQSIRNYNLNETMILMCGRRFLKGYTSPEVTIWHSSWFDNPHMEKEWVMMRFAKGHIHPIIREMLDNGYYVWFEGIDDYYVEGKSWYRQRHVNHDGMICGYDQEKKTYTVYSYDYHWLYRKYTVRQKDFEAGRRSMFKEGVYGLICGIKPKMEQVEFDTDRVYKNLMDYLYSSFEGYPLEEAELIYGIAVHDYIAMYVDKLFDGSIPYERMDRRVMRLIWEHKVIMSERIKKTEEVLKLGTETSDTYETVVAEANTVRMLYASHHMKRRDSVLPVIREKLLAIKDAEQDILAGFVQKMGGAKQECSCGNT